MDEAKLEALLAEATAHCYDDEDTFWGVFSALMANISYPLPVKILQVHALTSFGFRVAFRCDWGPELGRGQSRPTGNHGDFVRLSQP